MFYFLMGHNISAHHSNVMQVECNPILSLVYSPLRLGINPLG